MKRRVIQHCYIVFGIKKNYSNIKIVYLYLKTLNQIAKLLDVLLLAIVTAHLLEQSYHIMKILRFFKYGLNVEANKLQLSTECRGKKS